ncbi:type 2 periplasmic-binding domain-containing protein [Cyclobacterium lianum]|nr:ABC transporter substrate-binding protein [Cyclobacterium lianum]
MEKITITGVPEHFNFPWQLLVEAQPFLESDVQLVWEDESRGSGAMNKALREGNTDLAIVLTESFVKDKIEGNPGRMIGFHVNSPLIWGIHVPARTDLSAVEDLKNVPFLVSRMGSGSHLMTYLLAQRKSWNTSDIDFEIIGNLDGAIQSFRKNSAKAFLWEKYTTQPLVDKGLFKRIGEIPTPWPCFVIVASEKMLRDNAVLAFQIMDALYQINRRLMNDRSAAVNQIAARYQLDPKGVEEWIAQTTWTTEEEPAAPHLLKTMEILASLKLIDKKPGAETFIAPRSR